MLHTPHGPSTPDSPQQLMTEDLATRAFPCKVEGCGRTLVGLFQFATHEKYFHKLAASERASQCFMHSCPVGSCTMEYVRREDLQTHLGHAHPTAVPHSRACFDTQKPRSERVSPPSQESSINTPTSNSRSNSFSASPSTTSSSLPSLGIAAAKTSELEGLAIAKHQSIEKQPANVLEALDLGQGNFESSPGSNRRIRNEKRPVKLQLQVPNPTLPCPHVHCTNSFSSQSLLDKHIAKKHKRGVKFHVVPGVATLEPPFASHDQTPLGLQSMSAATPKSEGPPSIVSPTLQLPVIAASSGSQTAPVVRRGRVRSVDPDLLTQTPISSGPAGSGSTSTLNPGSQKRACANQPTQPPTSSPPICPFPGCGQVFRKARQRDRHLAQAHFLCPATAPTPPQDPVLTESDFIIPKEPAARVTLATQSAPASEFSAQKDTQDLRVEGKIAAQNLHSRDVLTCPVHGCSEIFNDLKDLLVHGRDLHELDTLGSDALGLYPITRPTPRSAVTVPASTRPVVTSSHLNSLTMPSLAPPSYHPQAADVSGPGPNPIKPAPIITKSVAVVPPMNSNLPGPSIQNQENLGPKSMRCLYPGCNSIFTRALDFRYHEKNIHGLTASAQCASMFKVHCHSCQKSYWTQESLDRHVLEKHSIPISQPQGPGPIPVRQAQAAPVLPPQRPRIGAEFQRGTGRFYCELCRLDFPTVENLNYHQAKSSYHRSLVAAAAGSQARAKGSIS